MERSRRRSQLQLAPPSTIAGRDCVLMLTNTGFSAIDPAAGKNAWTYEWKYDGYRTLQPLVVDESGILLGTGMGTGTRRVDVTLTDADPQIKDRWTSLEMKPDFNDYVAHKGCLYGFDHNIFACIDLKTGKRNWKKGRYGNGQVLLLPDADQLLVLTETGEVVVRPREPQEPRRAGSHEGAQRQDLEPSRAGRQSALRPQRRRSRLSGTAARQRHGRCRQRSRRQRCKGSNPVRRRRFCGRTSLALKVTGRRSKSKGRLACQHGGGELAESQSPSASRSACRATDRKLLVAKPAKPPSTAKETTPRTIRGVGFGIHADRADPTQHRAGGGSTEGHYLRKTAQTCSMSESRGSDDRGRNTAGRRAILRKTGGGLPAGSIP